MRGIIVTLWGLVFLLFIFILFKDNSRTNLKDISKKASSDQKRNLSPHPIKKSMKTSIQPKKDSVTKEILQKPQTHIIFKEIDIESEAFTLQKIENVEPLGLVHMKKDSIKNIDIGEHILLPTIDNNAYIIKITHRQRSERGNISIDGSFDEEGTSYHTILTEGVSSAYISMNTPSGNYEIELLDGLGYIYASNAIEKSKIDYTIPDTLPRPKRSIQ